jgi:hypothetical protein
MLQQNGTGHNGYAMTLNDGMRPRDGAADTASLMADLSGQIAYGRGRHAHQ